MHKISCIRSTTTFTKSAPKIYSRIYVKMCVPKTGYLHHYMCVYFIFYFEEIEKLSPFFLIFQKFVPFLRGVLLRQHFTQ